jgi:glycosyltransferase involved in cell wall biosynthesis
MNIAIAARSIQKSAIEKNIVETISLLTDRQPKHRFFIFSDAFPERAFAAANVEIKLIQSSNSLFQQLWWDLKLPGALIKTKADVLISFDQAYLPAISMPQCLVITNHRKIKRIQLLKAGSLAVTSESVKKRMIYRYRLPAEKISVLYLATGSCFQPVDFSTKELVKQEHSGGNEYFLYNGLQPGLHELTLLLKAYSFFKKRQRSRMKLLLLMLATPAIKKSLSTYKYRNDVIIILPGNEKLKALLTASAYAAVYPFDEDEQYIPALEAMQAAVPVIAPPGFAINEIAGDAALYFEPGNEKELGEKMIQLYTDEKFRERLIEKGKKTASLFTPQKTVEQLWKSVLKAFG